MSPKKKWWIKKIGKGWWIGHAHFALGDFFSTWERAYAEAVRRARIVEVELPPIMQNGGKEMARTLADMTPEERQACVGMWCDNLASAAKEPAPVVLACVQGELCWVLHTDLHGERSGFPLDSVAPRLDLPRAWNPGGSPVVMRQEWAARLESGGASIARTRTEAEQAHALHREQYENYGTGSYDMLGPPPPAPAGIQHRFTTEWEATDE